jgi:phosphate uptake regulator
MLKDLLNAWRDRSLLNTMYGEFKEMLKNAEWMFSKVTELLLKGGEAGEELQKKLFSCDILINKTERRIRKQIVEHLTIRPGADIAACLVLMSVVKDAERVGDYCKNLYDVWRLYGGPLKPGPFTDIIAALREELLVTFEKVTKAFSEEDEILGHEVIEKELAFAKRVDEAVVMLASSQMAVKSAVCYTLAFRHMKRISAHLGNIASAVVMPVHKIDYFDKKWQ